MQKWENAILSVRSGLFGASTKPFLFCGGKVSEIKDDRVGTADPL